MAIAISNKNEMLTRAVYRNFARGGGGKFGVGKKRGGGNLGLEKREGGGGGS